ncbi:hypothetical protein E2320_003559, partial [Naja naja]
MQKAEIFCQMVKQSMVLAMILNLVEDTVSLKCHKSDLIPVPHEWNQPADLLIGGMISQFFPNQCMINQSVVFYALKNCFKNCSKSDIQRRGPLFTYGALVPGKIDSTVVPSLYSMVSNEAQQYLGILKLLQHFGWTWIGMFIWANDNGQRFLQTMEALLFQNGICTAYKQKIPLRIRLDNFEEMIEITSYIDVPLTDHKTKVFLLYGES